MCFLPKGLRRLFSSLRVVPLGTTSLILSASYTLCGTGTYRDANSQTCTVCPSGTYNPKTGVGWGHIWFNCPGP